MLFLYNRTIEKEDLLHLYFESDSQRRQINAFFRTNKELNISGIHPYILFFFKNRQIVREMHLSDSKIIYELRKDQHFKEINQEDFRKFIDLQYEQDNKDIGRLKAFLRLKLSPRFKEIKKQLQSCEIKGKLVSTSRERILTIFNQDFKFRSWEYDGEPYFKEWMKKNELYLLNNLIKYPYI